METSSTRSDVEVFEILPMDRNLKPIFAQKWAYGVEGSTPTPAIPTLVDIWPTGLTRQFPLPPAS